MYTDTKVFCKKGNPMDPSLQPANSNMQPTFQVPSSWPGAFGAYKLSSELVKFNLSTFVFLFLISFFSGVLQIIPVLGAIVSIILLVFVTVALCIASFASIEGRKITLGESFSASKPYAFKTFLLIILLSLITIGTILLFIIPFFIVVPRLLLAPYLLVKKNLGVRESLRQSWELTKGNVGKVWGLIGLSLLFGVLCIILIGLYFAFMFQAAFALLAIFLLSQLDQNGAYQPTSPVPANTPLTPAQVPNAPAPAAIPQNNTPPNQPLTFAPTAPQSPTMPQQQPESQPIQQNPINQ